MSRQNRTQTEGRRRSDRIKQRQTGTQQDSARIVKPKPNRPVRRHRYFQVDKILDVQTVEGKRYYKVDWAKGPKGQHYEPSWEHEDNLTPKLLETWMAKQQTNETPSSTRSTISTAPQPSSSATNSHTVTTDAAPHPTHHLRRKSEKKFQRSPLSSGKKKDPINSIKDALKLLEQLEKTRSNIVAKAMETLAYLQGLDADHGNIES